MILVGCVAQKGLRCLNSSSRGKNMQRIEKVVFSNVIRDPNCKVLDF